MKFDSEEQDFVRISQTQAKLPTNEHFCICGIPIFFRNANTTTPQK